MRGFGSVAPHNPQGQLRSRSVARTAAAAAAAALLLCLAAGYGGRRGIEAPSADGTQALWEGDPEHHELPSKQSKIREVWGIPEKKMHYEPPHKLLKLGSLATKKQNGTGSTLRGTLSSDESRSAMQQYYDRLQAKEEALVKPAHDDAQAVMKATEAYMSAEDARKSITTIPKYNSQSKAQQEADIQASNKWETKNRITKDAFLKYNANVRAESDAQRIYKQDIHIDSDGEVHGLPKIGADADSGFSGAAPAPAAARESAAHAKGDGKSDTASVASHDKAVKNDERHLSGDKERETTSDYFDRLEKEELKNMAARRVIREKRAAEMTHEKEEEYQRIEREVAQSPGAGHVAPKDNTVDGVVQEKKNSKITTKAAARPASPGGGESVAFDGSPVKSWEDGPKLGEDFEARQMNGFRTSQLASMQRLVGETARRRVDDRLSTFRDETRNSQFVHPP